MHLTELKGLIRTIPDFPIAGIQFRDITPLIKDPEGFRAMIDMFVERFRNERIDVVVGVEARGYILAAPLAYELGAGFVPVRKPGKLPGSKMTEEYALEYGTNSLEVHDDAVGRGKRVLIVDDVLATGGTAAATGRLVERLGAEIVEFAFLIELEALGGRKALGQHKITSFISY
ncbi:MAG TPA: adenine phosphoribosyltransferase [Candidatus Acidoferrales bacterium]|nr:adenine phosphoribosyltransferase [Candidatus Acidoferrales bacterium]